MTFNNAEQALVAMLLGSESDLAERSDPMVFPIYGRGRALWAATLGAPPCDHLAFLPVLAEMPADLAVEQILPILDDVRAVICDGRIPDLVDGEWIKEELGPRPCGTV